MVAHTATAGIQVAGARHRRSRGVAGRCIATLCKAALALALIGASWEVMAPDEISLVQWASSARPAISFVDASGQPTSRPLTGMDSFFPGMTVRSSLHVQNTGPVPETFRLTATVQSGEPRSLDDVLRVTVRDRVTGAVQYRGRLSRLEVVEATPLQSGRSRTYDVQVDWPSTPNDDAYQGLALPFDLQVTGTPV
jgi:hypothetical protein